MRVKCTLDEAMTMLDSSGVRAVIGVFRCLSWEGHMVPTGSGSSLLESFSSR